MYCLRTMGLWSQEGGEFRQCVGIDPFWLKFFASLNSGEKDSGILEKTREWELEN